jgi:hypothetical protein
MSGNAIIANTISILPQGSLPPTQDLAAILAEVRILRTDYDGFKKKHNDFADRTANEIDDLFAKCKN